MKTNDMKWSAATKGLLFGVVIALATPGRGADDLRQQSGSEPVRDSVAVSTPSSDSGAPNALTIEEPVNALESSGEYRPADDGEGEPK